MAKNKIQQKMFLSLGRYILIIAFLVFCGVVLWRNVTNILYRSSMFKIKEVVVDPGLKFIATDGIPGLKGRNIFKADVRYVQRQLQSKYPQIANLRLIKKFPDRVEIVAKKRNPFVQLAVKNRFIVLDDLGVVIESSTQKKNGLPVVEGIDVKSKSIEIGYPLQIRELHTAFQLQRAFSRDRNLAAYQIMRIDLENLSKILLTLNNELNVIIDREYINRKIKMLGIVLARGKIDPATVKYVDVRFKEAIVGNK